MPNDPIYKTKDGQRVTKSQLMSSGYSDERIINGLGNGILSLIGDTETPAQLFRTKDGQSVTTEQLLNSGYSQDRIDKGVSNGILIPDEIDKKKVSLGSIGTEANLPDGIENISIPQSKFDLAVKGVEAAGGQLNIEPIKTINWQSEDPVGDVLKGDDKLVKKELTKNILDIITQNGIPNAAKDIIGREKELDRYTNSAFPTANEASDYLSKKLTSKGVQLVPKQSGEISDLLQDNKPKPIENNLDEFDLKDIAVSINPENATEIVAFNKYKKDRNINDAIKTNGISEESALNYAASQNAQIAAQLDKIKDLSKDKYDAYVGQMVMNFLYDPDVINKVKDNPELVKQWKEKEYNLYTSYPSLAKRIVAQKIGQKREDMHEGGMIADIPTKKGVDEIVDDMVKNGELDIREKNIYENELRPKIGFFKSVGRGLGNVFIPAFTNDAPIETTDLLGTLGESYKNTLRSTSHSVEDILNTISPIAHNPNGDKPFDNKNRLADLLQREYSTATIEPKGIIDQALSATGHLTGFVLPMILGGQAGAMAGITPKASNLISQGLVFEGTNKDEALKMFPDNTGKQLLYTTLATGGDLMLGELLPTEKALKGIKNSLKPELTKIVNEFTDGNITADAAKKTLLEKGTSLVKDVVKGNLKTAAVMSGFDIYHNALDAAFGGRDISFDDAANEAVQSFKTGFLGSTPLTAVGLLGENNKIKGSSLIEMADNADYYRDLINNQAILHPELKATKNERIANLNEAQLINKDLESTDLSEPQKQKYLLNALAEKIWLKKADKTDNEVIKNSYLQKAKEHQDIQEKIYKNEDAAPEFQETITEENVSLTPEENISTENLPADQKIKFRTDEEIDNLLNPIDEQGKKIQLTTSQLRVPREVEDIVSPENKKMSIKEIKNRATAISELINCLS